MGLGGGFRAKNPLPAYIVGDVAGYTHSGPSYWRMDGCSCRARVRGGEKECVCNQKVGLRRCLGRASIKAIHGLCMMYCDRALAARHRQGESAFSHWPSKLSVPGAIGIKSNSSMPLNPSRTFNSDDTVFGHNGIHIFGSFYAVSRATGSSRVQDALHTRGTRLHIERRSRKG